MAQALHRLRTEAARVDAARGDLGLAPAFGADRHDLPALQRVAECAQVAVAHVGDGSVRPVAVLREPDLGQPLRQRECREFVDELASRAHLGRAQPFAEFEPRGEVDLERIARLPGARNLQDRRPAEAAVREQQILVEGDAAPAAAGCDPDRQRQPCQGRERRPVAGVEAQRHERRPRLDDRQPEPARQAVAPVGGADLRDRQAAGRDHEARRSQRAAIGVDLEAVGHAAHGPCRGRLPARDCARRALPQQHRDHGLAAVVAEQLSLVLLVPADAVALQQLEEVRGRVARERRATEVRIGGQELRRRGLAVREVAPSAAGDADLLGDTLGVVEQQHAQTALAGHRGAEQAGRARADDDRVEVMAGVRCGGWGGAASGSWICHRRAVAGLAAGAGL